MLVKLSDKSPCKSCYLDHLPTWLLKRLTTHVAPVIASKSGPKTTSGVRIVWSVWQIKARYLKCSIDIPTLFAQVTLHSFPSNFFPSSSSIPITYVTKGLFILVFLSDAPARNLGEISAEMA